MENVLDHVRTWRGSSLHSVRSQENTLAVRSQARFHFVAGLAAACVSIFSAARPAGAQSAPSPAATIQPPRLKVDPGASYPEQAVRERFFEPVTVPLVLEIDASGAVVRAEVEAPQGHGFDEAAQLAATKLVFEPALRDGTPAAARIRFRYVFTPPGPRLKGRVLRQAGDAPIAGATVTVTDSNNVAHSATTSLDGSWSIPDLPAGKAQVIVAADGQSPLASDEDLTAGEETSLTLRLAPLPPPAATPAVQTEEPVEEVTVRGERPPREVTKRTVSKEEITHIPGTNGDALLSLQSLPGVARAPPFSGGLIVRGSAPQDTNVFVDGTNIPLIYHLGGFSSVVPSELLEKIDFVPGNYSATYGRGMGGVVEAGLRDPKKDKLHALAQVDLIDTRLVLEGPLLSTGWNFLAAGRRSWFDVWLTPILKGAGYGVTTAPVYYDYQLMLQRDLGPRSSLRFTLFGSDDLLNIINKSPSASNPTFGGDLGAHTNFWRVQARYDNKLTDRAELRLTAAYGNDSQDLGSGDRFVHTTLSPLSSRLELSMKLSDAIVANFGADLVFERYDLHQRRAPQRRPGQPDLGPTDTAITFASSGLLSLPAFYSEWELTPWRGARIVPGFRADYDSATGRWDLGPRINLRQDLTHGFPRTTLKGGVGIYDQPPTPLQTEPTYGQLGLSSNRSTHYDLGIEQELTSKIDISVDGFYKSFSNQVVAGLGNSGSGDAYGAEVFLRYKDDGRFFGWLSYTLSKSKRRSLPGEALSLFQYDQTQALTLVGSYKLGNGWQLGARFRLSSGFLYTPSSFGALDAAAGSQMPADGYPPYGQRLPLFQQLDLRLDKTWNFAGGKLTGYLDIQNVYIAANPQGISYNYNFTQSSYSLGLPIVPSLGLRGEF
jgi:TonB family protein